MLASLVSLHVSHVHRLVGYKLRRLEKRSSRLQVEATMIGCAGLAARFNLPSYHCSVGYRKQMD